MNGYYEEIVEEIESEIVKENYSQASYLIQKELDMPYIPEEIESKLKKMKRDIQFYLTEKKDSGEDSLDYLLELLKGSAAEQLRAAEGLLNKNLRECISEVKEWFVHDPQPEASALVIEELSRQGIDDEFELNRDGVEYSFYSQDVIPVVEQEGFRVANKYLQDWFIHQPDYYEIAKTLLIHEVYMFLPLSYEKEDGEGLAKAIRIQVMELLGDTVMEKN